MFYFEALCCGLQGFFNQSTWLRNCLNFIKNSSVITDKNFSLSTMPTECSEVNEPADTNGLGFTPVIHSGYSDWNRDTHQPARDENKGDDTVQLPNETKGSDTSLQSNHNPSPVEDVEYANDCDVTTENEPTSEVWVVFMLML